MIHKSIILTGREIGEGKIVLYNIQYTLIHKSIILTGREIGEGKIV